MKHTPGPWTADLETREVRGPDRLPVFEAVYGGPLEVAANLNLCAAAPEMLKALNMAMVAHGWKFEDGSPIPLWLRMVKEARDAAGAP